MNGEHLMQLCDNQGTIDGTLGRAFSPPVEPIACPNEAEVYARAYWQAVRAKPMVPQIEPDKALVQKAMRLAQSRHGGSDIQG